MRPESAPIPRLGAPPARYSRLRRAGPFGRLGTGGAFCRAQPADPPGVLLVTAGRGGPVTGPREPIVPPDMVGIRGPSRGRAPHLRTRVPIAAPEGLPDQDAGRSLSSTSACR